MTSPRLERSGLTVIDGVALVAIGAYLIPVLYHGRLGQLGVALWEDRDFLKYLAALAIIFGIFALLPKTPLVTSFKVMIIVGLILSSAELIEGLNDLVVTYLS